MDSDEELVIRSVGEPSAFEALVDRHAVALHGYLARRCGPVADDLLSDVWLAAFARRSEYDPELGPLRAWLFGIARNHVLAHWRREQVRARAAGELAAVAGGDGWEAVDARLDAAALLPALHQALSELPEVERELLLLTSWEQLTPAEAAQVAGVPAGTARSRLHRARARMRLLLGGPPGPDPVNRSIPTSRNGALA